MDDELLHFSAKPLARVKSAKQDAAPCAKPNGLWVSVGGAWAEWCLAGNFSTGRLACVNRVVLADDATILRLESAHDLDLFTEQYESDAARARNLSRYSIDWSAVARDFDGIIIAPYCYARRMSLLWYYGWDVASGCIWNARAVANIETLDIAALSTPSELLTHER